MVAELGRPETPAETAARKAENSRRHRSNQTLLNLIFALLASLGIVLFLVLVVVRPDGATRAPVDYRSDATQSEPSVGHTLAAPKLSTGWSANTDGVQTGSDKIVSWNVGLITPSQQYIGIIQGIDANPTWVANKLTGAVSTGTTSISGLTWQIYDRRTDPNAGNYAYSLSTVSGANSIVLHGTAVSAEFRTLAAAIIQQLNTGTQ